MSYRRKAHLGCDSSLLVVTSIVIVVNCSLIREVAARFALPPHQLDQYGDSSLSADKTSYMSTNPNSYSNPWWSREDRFTNIEDRSAPSAIRDEPSSMEDEYGVVARRNTGRSVSRRFRDTCGLAPRNPITNDRIFNGQTQKYGEWPSYVYILIIPGDIHFWASCGGTLVSDRHVLTAAHCVNLESGGVTYRLKPSEMILYHAFHSKVWPSEHQQHSYAKSICIARDFAPLESNPKRDDWALIELNEPVEFNDYIQPACLPEEPIQTKGDTSECWVVGAGLMRTHPYEVKAEYVQKLPVEQVPCDNFKKIDPRIPIFEDKHACYANHDVPAGNTCLGDSGGPVLCLDDRKRWTVVALASGGFNCTDEFPFSLLHYLGAFYTDMKKLLGDMKAQCGI